MLIRILKLSVFFFLFTSVFSGVNFFLPNELSFISGHFSHFSSVVVSLSDIFLILSVFLYLIILYNSKYKININYLKIENLKKIKKLENIDIDRYYNGFLQLIVKIKNLFNINKEFKTHNIVLENTIRLHTLFLDKKLNLLFIILALFAFITSLFLDNFSNFILHISILIKFFSVGFLFFYLPENIFSKKDILNTLIFSFIIQGFVAFYQVIFQSSLGLYFLGENNFGENIIGVAKIALTNGESFIRGYGTLGHPNILGLSSLILYFLSRKSGIKFLKNFLIIGIFFSFSKTAIIGFFILKLYEKKFLDKNNLFFNFKKILLSLKYFLFNLKHFRVSLKIFFNNMKNIYRMFYVLIFFSIFIFLGEKIFLRFQNIFGTGFQERITQIEISTNIITDSIENLQFFGIGFGNFIVEMQNFTNIILKPWEFQPVHNFFLLFGTEVGIFGLAILINLILYIFLTSKKEYYTKLFLVLLLLLGSSFDHFFLTSSIGIILFWIILRKIYN